MDNYAQQELSAGCPEHLMVLLTHVGPKENFLADEATNKSESQASSQISIHRPLWHLGT